MLCHMHAFAWPTEVLFKAGCQRSRQVTHDGMLMCSHSVAQCQHKDIQHKHKRVLKVLWYVHGRLTVT